MFQSASAEQVLSTGQPDRAGTPLKQASELIRRYPNLSDIELARLINLYRGLTSLDMALMLSDEKLAPNLDRFAREHRSKARPPFRQYAGLLAYVVLALGVLAWAIAAA